MTREEFGPQFSRLCNGHKFQATDAQYEAFYELLQHAEADDLRVAVTRLLAARGFPASVDVILREIEITSEHRRRAAVALERQQADQALTGKPRQVDGIEQEYRERRMSLVREAKNAKSFAEGMRDGIADLISDLAIARWAVQAPMGACGNHVGDHSVMDCLRDEMQYWTFRADGADSVAAYRLLKASGRAPIREELCIRVDGYGRTLADQQGTVEQSLHQEGGTL